MSFRQKIFFSQLLIFLIFVIFLYPVVTSLTERIQHKSLQHRVERVVKPLLKARNIDEMVGMLSRTEALIFFRLSLFEAGKGFVYDSHEQFEGNEYKAGRFPEIDEALSTGAGYEVRYSSLFEQEMAYVAVPFIYKNHLYVLRGSFPYGQILDLTHELTLAFSIIAVFILLLFSFLSWFIIHYFTAPVRKILETIRPYQMGIEEHIPAIELDESDSSRDEFGQLAETLNSLSNRIELQISSLTQERNEKDAILESLIEGVVAVDAKLNVIYMNQTAELFLNIREKDLVGASFTLAQQPECEMLILQAQKKSIPLTTVLKPKRGQKRFFDAVAAPRGGNEGAILVLQDKTGLHKVIELGRDFIANASHELKTPITIIRGFAETLHDHPELSQEMNQEITGKIVSNCGRMETLIRNLLTLAAVDEGLPQSRLRNCDILDIIGQARLTTLTVHRTAEIEVKMIGEEPFVLQLDSDLFLQAILNLLENAAKYSRPPAKILVTVEKTMRHFKIQVKDEGLGIPAEDCDRIFERFYAVDKSHSRSLGGSGLGLSIVERIIEKHQGKIEVSSKVGEGTTFTITLPTRQDGVM
ncbi:MAG: Adaptive-response sensory-kinase SasA [Chlamydiales bacterium]|nr:Adaptive-response sensory-kinase SasA [Chlamydiales bacterium]MCH9636294.1 Adaptive-response sensory-kinase SasA [Chlamydiales bacterium]MCH9703192.1 PAS domain-containing protein [Chlamydiota bacterium]